MREVALSDWRSAAEGLAGQYLVQLAAVQPSAGSPVELWLRDSGGDVIWTRLDAGAAPSLAAIWPLACGFEQRIAADFGVEFDRTAPPVGAGGLRKTVLLARRHHTAWPGRKDPSDRGGAPSRRRQLPLGVVDPLPAGTELR